MSAKIVNSELFDRIPVNKLIIGQLGEDAGSIYLRTYNGIVELNNPRYVYDLKASFKVIPLRFGTVVEYTSKDCGAK